MTQGQTPGWGPSPGSQPPAAPPPGNWGAPQEPTYPAKYCHACGSTIDGRAEICPRCGVRQTGSTSGSPKSRAIAAALALFLGVFGIHRFYLGQVAWGIVYLIFFWTYIPALIAWVEAIYFLTRSNEDWARDHGGPVQQPNPVGIGCLWVVALWPLIAIAAIASLIFLGGAISDILYEIGTEI